MASIINLPVEAVFQCNGKKRLFFTGVFWFLWVKNVQKQMLVVLSHITNCSLQIKSGKKKTIAYSLTLAKLSCDKAAVKWALQTTQCCAKIRGILQCTSGFPQFSPEWKTGTLVTWRVLTPQPAAPDPLAISNTSYHLALSMFQALLSTFYTYELI